MLGRVLGRAVRILLLLIVMLLEYLLDRLKLRWLWWRITGSGEPYRWDRNEVIVREAFENMGPTFVKLGQVVALAPQEPRRQRRKARGRPVISAEAGGTPRLRYQLQCKM